MFLDFSLSLLFNCKEKERNMGRATAGASQIYAVVRPERNAVERECNEAKRTFFYLSFSISRVALLLKAKQNFSVLGEGQRG